MFGKLLKNTTDVHGCTRIGTDEKNKSVGKLSWIFAFLNMRDVLSVLHRQESINLKSIRVHTFDELSSSLCSSVVKKSFILLLQMLLAYSVYPQEKKVEETFNSKNSYQGFVMDAKTKRGIENATVEMKNLNLGVGFYSVKTDKKGFFEIKDFIPEINYQLSIEADGYINYTSSGSISNTKENTKYLLEKEGVLYGVVKDSRGKNLEGVEVKVKSDNYYISAKSYTTLTNEKGYYKFEKLKEGSYSVSFEKSGRISETARVKRIKSGERFHLPMRLFKTASISGTILIEDLKVPAIGVNAILSSLRVTHSAVTFSNGEFRIEDIKPGKYTLKISHRGFHEITKEEIVITEGKEVEKQSFIIKPKEPGITVSTNRYVFSPADKIQFDLRTFRIEKVKIKIYQVPENLQAEMLLVQDSSKVNAKEKNFKLINEWEETMRNFQLYDWNYMQLDLKDKLPTATYMIEVEGEDNKYNSKKFFSVTSVGIVVKRSVDSVFVYATDLISNIPLTGAKFYFYEDIPVVAKDAKTVTPNTSEGSEEYEGDGYNEAYADKPSNVSSYNFKLVQEAVADEFGIFQYKTTSSRNILVVAVGKDGSNAFSETGNPKSYASEKNKFFIYTERPVYRAGDTVFFKILGKKSEGKFLPDANTKVKYEILSPGGESIESKEVELDEWGSFSGEFLSKKQDALGEYGINVTKGESTLTVTGSAYFFIEQYRKPEYKIEITPSENAYVNGETAEFKVEAKYFFGSPLANANVSYRFYENKLRDTNTTYWWEEEYESNVSYNQLRMEGDKELNENGLALLKFKLGNYPYDRQVTLEATVIDKSNVSITSRKTITVGRGKFYIKINPLSSFYYTKDKKEFEIKTVDYEGKPVSANVTLQFFRYIWKPWQRVYMHEEKPVFIQKINTNESGIYKLELNSELATAGEFDIVATSSDVLQNQITASRVIWLYSGTNDRMESKFKNLELTLDKSSIDKPGEITVLLKSKFVDNYVCLTLEGRDVYETKVVKMDGNLQAVKLNIKPEYAPNLFITATMQKNRALYTTNQGLEFPHVDTRVQIKIKADKEKYLPRETVQLEIVATSEEGKPIEGDFSLGVVDEAIYQIRADHTSPMNPFFYSKISNWVSTNYSYPMTLLAGTSKDGRDTLVRENFKDTAFWKSDVRTKKDGKAYINFEVPDNLTEWRLTLRGHDKEGRVGETISSVLVTQDLVARIAKPRFLTESDKLSVIGIVNNNSKEGMSEVKTEMLINEREIKAEEKEKISLPPFGASKQHYPITVPNADNLQIQFNAKANEKAKDAILHKVPIYKNGIAFKIGEMGDMGENSTVKLNPTKNDKNISVNAEELEISLNPSPIEKICNASQFLAEYPYGCVEQTLNKFLPAVEIWYLDAKKFPSIPQDPKLPEKVKEGVKRLEEMQNDDGSWGWWNGDAGNEYLTGYVMAGLHNPYPRNVIFDTEVNEKISFSFEPTEAINKGKAAIQRMLSNPQGMEDDARAYLLYVASIYELWSPSSFEKLSKKETLSPYSRAFLLRALVHVSPIAFPKDGEKLVAELKKQIPILIEKLKSAQKKDDKGIYFDNSPSSYYGWQGGNTEISAHVLSALLEAGDKSSLPASLMSSIQKRSSGGLWNSTKETATVISAITKYLQTKGAQVSSQGKVDFSLNGKSLTSIEYDTTKSSRELRKYIPLKEDAKNYTVTATGTKSSDLSFDLALKGTLKFKDKDLLGQELQSSIDSLQNGIKLKRNFYSVKRIRDMNNQEYLVPHKLVGSKLQVGEELLVKLQFKADKDYEYLLLEDFLPSGFEVTKTDAYEGTRYYTHSERRDEKMAFFFSKLNKGKVYEIAYMIRAELPGRFNVKPACIECMYAPEFRGLSLPTRLLVEK